VLVTFFVAFVVLIPQSCGQCGTHTFGTERYELDALTGAYAYTSYQSGMPVFTHTWNFCKNVTIGGVAAFQEDTETKVVHITGRLPAQIYRLSDPKTPGVVVKYTNNLDDFCISNIRRSVSINVYCGPSLTPKVSSIEEVQPCQYNITMEAVAACPLGITSCGKFTGSSGTTYDLTSLTTAEGYKFQAEYTYFWNFCKDVTNSVCPQSAVCQVSSNGVAISLGFLPAIISEGAGDKKGVTVTYVNNQRKCAGGQVPTIHIQVACDPSAISPVVITIIEPSVCTYIISMASAVTCSSSSGKELCCLYQVDASQKTLCTSDLICPSISGYQHIGEWHVSNCTLCKTPALFPLV